MERGGLCGEDIKKYAVPNGHPFVTHGSLIYLYEPQEKTQRALACICFDGHAYFLKTARSVAQWQVRTEFCADMKVMMRNEHRTAVPPIHRRMRWGGTPWVGCFYTENVFLKSADNY